MKIACITPIKHLDGVFEKMATFGDVLYHPEITKEDLKKLLLENKDIDTLFTNPNKQEYKIDKELLEGTSISVINTASTGMNHIDVTVCDDLNIKVYSLTKDYELIKRLPSTSELAFGLMLSLLRHIPQSFDAIKSGEWNYEKFIGRQTEGLTLGVIGFGRLGHFMAKYGKAFGMNVLIHDPYNPVYGYDKVSLEELAKKSDVISLHVHVTDETKYMINSDVFDMTEKKPYIINTSRGEIIDEEALVSALKAKKISGYGTDVIEDEFGDWKNSPIIKAIDEGLNILVTPHTGGMTWEGQQRAYMHAVNKFSEIKV